MSRYVTPVLLLVGSALVWQYNSSHASSQLVLPGLDMAGFGDPLAQGRVTWQITGAAGGVFLLGAIFGHLKARAKRK